MTVLERDRDIEIGRRLAALRAARGWSQAWLAAQAGMTQSVLSRVEAGKREARASEIAELAHALGVGPETLLDDFRETAGSGHDARSSSGDLSVRAPAPLQDTGSRPPPVGSATWSESRLEEPAPPPFAAEDERRILLDSETEQRDAALTESDARRARRWGPPGNARRLDDVPRTPERRVAAFSAGISEASGAFFKRGESEAATGPEDAAVDAQATPSSVPPAAKPRIAPKGPLRHLGDTRPPVALPAPVARLVGDYFRVRAMTDDEALRNASWDTIDAYGRRRRAGKPSGLVAGRPAAAVSWNEPRDRYARLWRHELGIGVDGPVPDLVALFEDAGVAEVVVARLETDEPVCAVVTVHDPAYEPHRTAAMAIGAIQTPTGRSVDGPPDEVSFLFVNAQRPVTLQRHALAHAFAHLALGHGDVVDRRIEWSRAAPLETEANDFAEEFLAPVDAVARWYDRHDDPAPGVDVLLELAGAFGVTFWAALYRSRAAGRLGPKPFARLQRELRARQWQLLPEQSLRGGLRDTLSTLSEEAPLPPAGAVGVGGVRPRLTRDATVEAGPGPAVLRVPARLRVWTLQALRGGLLSLEQAAAVLHRPPAALAAELERLGLE